MLNVQGAAAERIHIFFNNKDHQRLPQEVFYRFSLFIDKLLTDLNLQGYEVIGFVDDIVIMIRDKGDLA
jgi:hypothetical protein